MLLIFIVDIYCKYTWVTPLKGKKGITITNGFENFLDESNRKPNEILVDKGSEIYNKSMLQDAGS